MNSQYSKYERITDQDELEARSDNVPQIKSSSDNSNILTLFQNRKRIFLGGLLIGSLILFFSLFLSNNHNLSLQQPYLSKITPYRQIIHPDQPTNLWGSISKPYPTGAFWTNLVVKNGDGAVAVYPYGVKTMDVGIQVSYSSSHRQVSSSYILDAFAVDLQVSATQAYLSRGIETCDNVSVTMGYKTAANGRYRVILVKGSPFITVVYDGATPIISSPNMKILSVDAKLVKDSIGTQYLVTLGNYQKWLVYCSEPVVLSWRDNGIIASNPIKGFIRVAILPNQNAEAAFNTLLSYVQRYPTGATMTLTYPTATSAVVNLQYNTVGPGSLLMLALPHHMSLFPLAFVNNDESLRVQSVYTPIWCIKGRLKAMVGENWKLAYNLVSPGWNYQVTDRLSTPQMDEIAKYLIQEIRAVVTAAPDVYSFGKQLGRMARLALIADNFGIADARQQAIFTLETSIIPWLQGMNQDILLFDKTYGGIVSTQSLADSNSNFGSGWYADHHFHYGYFVHAVAVLAKLDLPFYDANKAALDVFIRDICNPDPTDPDFPLARHKDFFDGHSWASGLFQQANGKGQESSSEATNAYYGAYLYASALGNLDLQRFSQLLMTMEIQAAQTYWHMSTDDIYDNIFAAGRMVGNVGAFDVTSSTWFGNQVEFVHGINMMPLSPVTAYLFDSSYVQTQYPVLANRLTTDPLPSAECSANPVCSSASLVGSCCPTADGVILGCCEVHQGQSKINDEWKSLIHATLAVIDRDTGFDRLITVGGFGIGNSRANSLFWAATRAPPIPGYNATKRIPDKTPKSTCSANSACDATGMTGECCPTSNGVYLGCCPRTNA